MSAVLDAIPARWRSENTLMLAALSVSALLLIAFCAVVSGVVRNAEQQHLLSASTVMPATSTTPGAAPDRQAVQSTDREELPSQPS